jgi:hypothetical protein
MGFLFVQLLAILPIDKLLELWYNGISGRMGRARPAKNYTIKAQKCQLIFYTKMKSKFCLKYQLTNEMKKWGENPT